MSDQPAPDLGEVMTVVEFATKHCREHCQDDDMRREIQHHVDTLVFGAMVTGYSLLWQSMPEPAWDYLLQESLKIAAVQSMIRGLL
jgi:hypothetical protein